MKKSVFLVALCVLFSLLHQTDTHAQSKNAFYVELLGNGLLFSANYDTRFSAESNLGARVGVGYVGSVEGDGGVLTVPLMINTLLGKDGQYFEVGAGVTILSANAEFIDDVTATFGTLSFMYRKQPVDGGFMWKIGITPIIAEGVFVPYWAGLGLGYSW